MRKYILPIAALSFLALPVQAEIDPRICETLQNAAKIKSATYEEGVDNEGNAVVPADLASGSSYLPTEEIKIPLQIDLFKASGLDNSSFPFSSLQREDINLGTLTLRENQLFWNDKPLNNAQEAELLALCTKTTRNKDK